MLAGLLAVYLLIFLLDLKVLIEERRETKALAAYFILLSLGFVISLLQIIDKAPPSPAHIIEKAVKFVLGG